MAAAATLKIAFSAITHRPIVRFQRIFYEEAEQHELSMSTRAAWQKLQIFKIQDGGRSPFWKWLNRHLSEKSSNFDETWYTASDIEPDDSLVTKIKIFIIQDGGGRHLENRFFGHNSSTDSPISAKFFMRKQNSMSTRGTWQKLQIFKIQDGGRPPFWKWLNRHISVKKCPILMKLGTLHQILNLMTVTWPKIEIF